MADLKPCPFCGHSAALESVGADHFVMCDGCCAETARFQSPTGDNQRAIEHAIAAWNKRAAAPAAQGEDARDAARYRWLRDSGDSPRVLLDGRWYGTQHRACLDLDSAIDAAMSKERGNV